MHPENGARMLPPADPSRHARKNEESRVASSIVHAFGEMGEKKRK
jgi:hypothetical protein